MAIGKVISALELVLVALAYFVYGRTIDAVFGMILVNAIAIPAMIIGLIPFIGFILSYMVMHGYLYPLVFGFTGMYATWVTTIMFGVQLVIATVATCGTTYFLLFKK